MGLVDRQPARAVVLVAECRLGVVAEAHGEDGSGHDPVHGRLMELIDEIEVVERLDVRGAEPGLLGNLAKGPRGDAFAVLQRTRHALPEPGQDPAWRTAQEQDLGALHAARGQGHPEHPAIHEIRAERAHLGRLIDR